MAILNFGNKPLLLKLNSTAQIIKLKLRFKQDKRVTCKHLMEIHQLGYISIQIIEILDISLMNKI